MVAMFVDGLRQNEQSLERTFHRCFLPSFGFSEDFQKSTNQKQELPVAAMFVNESGQNEQSLQRIFQGCSLPCFDSFGQAVSEEKIFQKSTNQKQEWTVASMFVNGWELNAQSLYMTFQGCFLPRFDSFGKAVLWQPCLLMDWDKMSNVQRGPSIDASYQVSLHLAEGFQRRRLKCEKLTDDGPQMPSDGKSSHCLWQGELKSQ